MLYLAYFILYLYVFIIGACIASFINVVIYRLPRHLSIVKGRSFCPKCNQQLKWYDLLPLLSFLILKKQCRNCKSKISFRYCTIEFLGGILCIITVLRYGFTIKSILIFVIFMILLAIAVIDIDTMTIPNILIIFLVTASLLFIIITSDLTFISHIIGAFCISLPMLLLTVIIKDSFGGGDIKLMFTAGFLLGSKSVLLAGFIGILLGGIYGFYLIIHKKVDKKSHFAFGPFLTVGIGISLLWSESIINFYLYFTNELLVSLFI